MLWLRWNLVWTKPKQSWWHAFIDHKKKEFYTDIDKINPPPIVNATMCQVSLTRFIFTLITLINEKKKRQLSHHTTSSIPPKQKWKLLKVGPPLLSFRNHTIKTRNHNITHTQHHTAQHYISKYIYIYSTKQMLIIIWGWIVIRD